MPATPLIPATPTSDPWPTGTEQSVFANMDELNRLLASVDVSEPEEEFFLGEETNNRRKDCRQPFLAELVVVLVSAPNAHDEAFRFIRGWTQDLSPGGVGFVVSEQLPQGRHLMLIQHPDFPSPKHCFLGSISWERCLSPHQWEYGALLRPSFSTFEELELIHCEPAC